APELLLRLVELRRNFLLREVHRAGGGLGLGAQLFRLALSLFGELKERLGLFADLLAPAALLGDEQVHLGALGPDPLHFVPEAVLLRGLALVLFGGGAVNLLGHLRVGLDLLVLGSAGFGVLLFEVLLGGA